MQRYDINELTCESNPMEHKNISREVFSWLKIPFIGYYQTQYYLTSEHLACNYSFHRLYDQGSYA